MNQEQFAQIQNNYFSLVNIGAARSALSYSNKGCLLLECSPLNGRTPSFFFSGSRPATDKTGPSPLTIVQTIRRHRLDSGRGTLKRPEPLHGYHFFDLTASTLQSSSVSIKTRAHPEISLTRERPTREYKRRTARDSPSRPQTVRVASTTKSKTAPVRVVSRDETWREGKSLRRL